MLLLLNSTVIDDPTKGKILNFSPFESNSITIFETNQHFYYCHYFVFIFAPTPFFFVWE